MGRILVTCYSRSGYTRRVAERLARLLDAQLSPITEQRQRQGPAGYLQSAWEALRQRQPPIDPPSEDPAQYDLVVIGTPVWAGHLSSPVRSYARQHGRGIRRVAFFCTLGGSGERGAFEDLQQVLGQMPVATLALTDADIDSGAIEQPLRSFAATLRSGLTVAGRGNGLKRAA